MEKVDKNRWKELRTLANSGNDEAQWEIGYYHENGAADESGNVLAGISLSESLRWYTLSAMQGNSDAQCSLSTILSTGEGITRDYQAAIYWAKKAVAQGNNSAAFNLGTIYRDLKKPAVAFRWYKRAVSMGDNDSLLQVGLCYLFGFGAKQDVNAAYGCFKGVVDGDSAASCQRSKEDALYWMAVVHLVGMGNIKRSVKQARGMLEIANADDDHEQANEILNIIGKSKYLPA